ncbi:uncharacterized protein MONBRDRAFT_7483 [Monosiga brevicollis MX1]|uniref:Protein-S-isoprenylcysteine O-methyltransferase n=1 Tax=Monosiga brevicollis TaxID=81824 RepID=A9UX32_MONBE|nr:uncharacterized protein MONBRDRAFT_7483 [Monosiga brevicollis MX1]EDQ90144.1 predicted protein [Monosiga brevicollis MX1]|eukprot:XP_001744911.1 hypothetical protein [Monosiga brevicollis MX1]
MGFFHCSEYVMTALYNRDVLSFDSFLINHSRSYHVAALSCCIEYYLEMRYCPIIKSLNIISYAGLAMVGLGEAFRKLAMWTAGSNFKHIVATNKLESHELVTTGIYSLCRHPAYAGWFWWAVGTQVLLCNPFCSIAYGWAAYRFFADRLEYEEYHLLLFFGTQYHRYQQRVPTGVPFVQGYVAREQLLSYLTAREQSAATSS